MKDAVAPAETSPSQVERACHLLDGLIPRNETVDRFDADYLDDLHHILREEHGIGAASGGTPAQRKAVAELRTIAGLSERAPLSELGPALARAGVPRAGYAPHRADETTKKKFRYAKVPSWKKAKDVTLQQSPDAVETIKKVQIEFSLQQGGKHGYEFDALARPETGDPWTPFLQGLVQQKVLRADEPALTIGPRWAGEIRYFRQVVGLTGTIGLDLFSHEPDLVKVGDMHKMPFPDSHFGLVYQRNTFNKSYDIRKALLECVRVLRPGGVLVSDDLLGYKIGVTELARTNMKTNRWMVRFLGDHVDKVLYDQETPSGQDWFERVGQVAIRIRK